MINRIDLLVGSIRAAELINSYRARLCELDLLPDDVALAVACTAYANGCVYVVAAPGQIWERPAPEGAEPQQLRISEITMTACEGYCAVCQEPCGISLTIPLDVLDSAFTLTRWPDPACDDL